jgi:hypothetical protein
MHESSSGSYSSVRRADASTRAVSRDHPTWITAAP